MDTKTRKANTDRYTEADIIKGMQMPFKRGRRSPGRKPKPIEKPFSHMEIGDAVCMGPFRTRVQRKFLEMNHTAAVIDAGLHFTSRTVSGLLWVWRDR